MPRFDLAAFRKILLRPGYGIIAQGKAPHAVMERSAGHGPLAAKKTQALYPGKCLVRFVAFRTRLCDEDNLCEKFFGDFLRYAGIIQDDAPEFAHIVTTQERVAHKKDECTVITIQRL